MVRPRSDWSECYTTKGCGYGKTNGQTGQNVILLKVVVMVRPWSDWSECYITKGCGYGKTKVRLVRMLYY